MGRFLRNAVNAVNAVTDDPRTYRNHLEFATAATTDHDGADARDACGHRKRVGAGGRELQMVAVGARVVGDCVDCVDCVA